MFSPISKAAPGKLVRLEHVARSAFTLEAASVFVNGVQKPSPANVVPGDTVQLEVMASKVSQGHVYVPYKVNGMQLYAVVATRFDTRPQLLPSALNSFWYEYPQQNHDVTLYDGTTSTPIDLTAAPSGLVSDNTFCVLDPKNKKVLRVNKAGAVVHAWAFDAAPTSVTNRERPDGYYEALVQAGDAAYILDREGTKTPYYADTAGCRAIAGAGSYVWAAGDGVAVCNGLRKGTTFNVQYLAAYTSKCFATSDTGKLLLIDNKAAVTELFDVSPLGASMLGTIAIVGDKLYVPVPELYSVLVFDANTNALLTQVDFGSDVPMCVSAYGSSYVVAFADSNRVAVVSDTTKYIEFARRVTFAQGVDTAILVSHYLDAISQTVVPASAIGTLDVHTLRTCNSFASQQFTVSGTGVAPVSTAPDAHLYGPSVVSAGDSFTVSARATHDVAETLTEFAFALGENAYSLPILSSPSASHTFIDIEPAETLAKSNFTMLADNLPLSIQFGQLRVNDAQYDGHTLLRLGDRVEYSVDFAEATSSILTVGSRQYAITKGTLGAVVELEGQALAQQQTVNLTVTVAGTYFLPDYSGAELYKNGVPVKSAEFLPTDSMSVRIAKTSSFYNDYAVTDVVGPQILRVKALTEADLIPDFASLGSWVEPTPRTVQTSRTVAVSGLTDGFEATLLAQDAIFVVNGQEFKDTAKVKNGDVLTVLYAVPNLWTTELLVMAHTLNAGDVLAYRATIYPIQLSGGLKWVDTERSEPGSTTQRFVDTDHAVATGIWLHARAFENRATHTPKSVQQKSGDKRANSLKAAVKARREVCTIAGKDSPTWWAGFKYASSALSIGHMWQMPAARLVATTPALHQYPTFESDLLPFVQHHRAEKETPLLPMEAQQSLVRSLPISPMVPSHTLLREVALPPMRHDVRHMNSTPLLPFAKHRQAQYLPQRLDTIKQWYARAYFIERPALVHWAYTQFSTQRLDMVRQDARQHVMDALVPHKGLTPQSFFSTAASTSKYSRPAGSLASSNGPSKLRQTVFDATVLSDYGAFMSEADARAEGKMREQLGAIIVSQEAPYYKYRVSVSSALACAARTGIWAVHGRIGGG